MVLKASKVTFMTYVETVTYGCYNIPFSVTQAPREISTKSRATKWRLWKP